MNINQQRNNNWDEIVCESLSQVEKSVADGSAIFYDRDKVENDISLIISAAREKQSCEREVDALLIKSRYAI